MMAQLSDLTRPVVRAGTGFHRNDAPGLRCSETEKLRASDALAEQHMPGSIRSMQVEHVFRDVQTDRGSLLHGRLLRWQFDTATLAHRCRRGASTPSPDAADPQADGGYGARLCENVHERRTVALFSLLSFPHSGHQCFYFS